jgi:hypothetical protein
MSTAKYVEYGMYVFLYEKNGATTMNTVSTSKGEEGDGCCKRKIGCQAWEPEPRKIMYDQWHYDTAAYLNRADMQP